MSTIAITIFVNQKILLPTLLTIEEVVNSLWLSKDWTDSIILWEVFCNMPALTSWVSYIGINTIWAN